MYEEPKNLYSKFCVGPTFGKLIYDLMISGFFKNVLEIGCFQGYSTHSFISALNDGAKFDFTICDVNIQQSVENLIKNLNIKKEKKESKFVINKNFDFIFVDGNHSLCSVAEELDLILKFKTKTILAHDTFIMHPEFKGAVFLHKVLSNQQKYFYLYHNKHKTNDQTHYGISFFTQDKIIYNYASKLFNKIDNKINKFL